MHVHWEQTRSSMHEVKCRKCRTAIAHEPFDDGAIAQLECGKCKGTSAFRSPLPMSETDVLAQLGGDASLLAIDVAPPKDAVPPSLATEAIEVER